MATTLISFDQTFLYGDKPGALTIRPQTIQKTTAVTTAAINAVEGRITASEYGFISVLAESRYLDQVEAVFAQLTWADTLVVVGIGGSDLGARAIQQALEGEHPPMRVLFHGDSTDPEAITRLFRTIDLAKTVFMIISKSGQTVETIAQYVFLKSYLKERKEDWQRHFVFITDEKEGILRPEADQHAILTLPIPPSVGGRFSVLTPVGLLAARAMGVAIKPLVDGAAAAAADSAFRHMAQEIATSQFQLYQQGIKICVMMPYAIQLGEFARWFRQLWAESLGKDGKGIMPIQAWGPADQHSQQQFYNEGEALQSLLFLRLETRNKDYSITGVDIADVAYLEGHSFLEILNIEQETAALALKKVGRPAATVKLEKLTPTSLGQLFMLFELAVVYLAEMLGVNAFDQPGVEEGKQMIYALLGQTGYQEKKKEIDQLRKSSLGL